MPLANYGLLTGTVVEHWTAGGRDPHYLALRVATIQVVVSRAHMALRVETSRAGRANHVGRAVNKDEP
jgi:hypothetical protein